LQQRRGERAAGQLSCRDPSDRHQLLRRQHKHPCTHTHTSTHQHARGFPWCMRRSMVNAAVRTAVGVPVADDAMGARRPRGRGPGRRRAAPQRTQQHVMQAIAPHPSLSSPTSLDLFAGKDSTRSTLSPVVGQLRKTAPRPYPLRPCFACAARPPSARARWRLIAGVSKGLINVCTTP
jgi:hypothetical protein